MHAVVPKGESIGCRGREEARPTPRFLGSLKNRDFGTETMPHSQRGELPPFVKGKVLGGQGLSCVNFKKNTLALMELERPIGGTTTYVANGTVS